MGVRAIGNSIQYDFYYKRHRVRPSKPLRPTANNLKWAAGDLARIKDKIVRGEFSWWKEFPESGYCQQFEPQSTVREALLEWLISVKRGDLAFSTVYGYEKSVLHKLIPRLGHLRLDELTSEKLHEFTDSLDLAVKTKQETLIPLRHMVRRYKRLGMIREDPFASFQLEEYRPQRTDRKRALEETDVFSGKERLAIREHTQNPIWEFAIWTGLRVSELIALKWSRVDLERKRVEVCEARVLGHEKGPKTGTSVRFVKLLPPAERAIRRQRSVSRWLPGNYVWLNPNTGRRYHDDQTLRKELTRVCQSAGIPRKLPRFTRHTYASLMLGAGESLVWVSKQLGHSNIVITAERYVRFLPDAHENAGMHAVAKWGT